MFFDWFARSRLRLVYHSMDWSVNFLLMICRLWFSGDVWLLRFGLIHQLVEVLRLSGGVGVTPTICESTCLGGGICPFLGTCLLSCYMSVHVFSRLMIFLFLPPWKAWSGPKRYLIFMRPCSMELIFLEVWWCSGGSFSIGSPALFHRCSPLSFSLALVHGSSFLLWCSEFSGWWVWPGFVRDFVFLTCYCCDASTSSFLRLLGRVHDVAMVLIFRSSLARRYPVFSL